MARVEILTIGDELLRGDIVDTNAAWLGERLFEAGLPVGEVRTVGDALEPLVATLRALGERADVAVASGGLGPTEDDRTMEAAARAAGVGRALHEPSLGAMRERFARIDFEMTPNNVEQARIPVGSEALPNAAGTAPGFAMAIGRCRAFFLPGVPREMEAMFAREVAPRLAGLGRRRFVRTLRVFRMGESHVDHRLRGIETPGVSLHFQTRFPENLVKLVSDDEAALARAEAAVRERLGGVVYGADDETLPARAGAALAARGATVAVAESCTGGIVGALLTDVPGASAWFRGGVVAYANDVKTRVLGVREETLARDGAVSRACVVEMAEGARRLAGATFGVGVSGVAGPTGGTPDKPVGTVHVAVAGPEETFARKLSWPGTREMVRKLAAHAALALLLRACEGALVPGAGGTA